MNTVKMYIDIVHISGCKWGKLSSEKVFSNDYFVESWNKVLASRFAPSPNHYVTASLITSSPLFTYHLLQGVFLEPSNHFLPCFIFLLTPSITWDYIFMVDISVVTGLLPSAPWGRGACLVCCGPRLPQDVHSTSRRGVVVPKYLQNLVAFMLFIVIPSENPSVMLHNKQLSDV